jgi:hypothetical protein
MGQENAIKEYLFEVVPEELAIHDKLLKQSGTGFMVGKQVKKLLTGK